jgi:hypothetical protein
VKYVLATNWRDHWDKLAGDLTSLSTNMLVPPMTEALLRSGTPTVFLLFSRLPREPLRAWSGRVNRIEHTPGFRRITFRVKLNREIRFPREYAGLPDGWYVEDPEPAPTASGLW